MHTHLRMLQKYFMIQRMCSRVMAKNIFNKKVSSIVIMEERHRNRARYYVIFSRHPRPSWTPDGRKFGSSPGAFGSGQSAHSAAK